MRKLFAFILLLSNFQVFSQIDQKAKVILDDVSAKTKSYSSITAEFEFIMENNEVDLHEVNQGSVIVQKDKYKLNISGIELFCDGESQWTYMEDAQEVNISETDTDNEESINPATIFTIYEKGYKYTLLGEFTSNNSKTYKIELIPTEEKEFTKVILEIDQNTSQILNASMYGTDQNQYTIKVKKMDTSKTYPASTFVFDEAKHPGVDVIDMR